MNGYKKKNRLNYINNFMFKSVIIKKLLHNFMKDGKQYAAYRIIFKVFRKIKKVLKKNPSLLLHIFVYKSRLPIELISIKKSGRIYKLPNVVNIERQYKIVLKLLSVITKENKQLPSSEILNKEFFDMLSSKKKTLLIKKFEGISKIAIENQPFMHFRWISKKRIKKPKKKKLLIF